MTLSSPARAIGGEKIEMKISSGGIINLDVYLETNFAVLGSSRESWHRPEFNSRIKGQRAIQKADTQV